MERINGRETAQTNGFWSFRDAFLCMCAFVYLAFKKKKTSDVCFDLPSVRVRVAGLVFIVLFRRK
jgi:hypothetical protein